MNITFSSKEAGGYYIKTAKFGDEKYYFKIPSAYKNEITELADPFVILLIFTMMRHGGDISIKGTVSKSLLDNMELFASYWNVLLPAYYKKIKITADEEFDDKPAALPDKAIACFSGGLDASFMLYRHKKRLAGRNNRNIERCILIHGADIKLSAKKRFEEAFLGCEAMCGDLGAGLVPVEMNYRSYPHDWEMEHMAFMAAALRFWKNYPYQMAGSTYPVNLFKYPWSANPVTDRLFSSNLYKMVSDDINFGRTEKAGIVKNWQAGMKNLRVCWESAGTVNNCGVCEKCVRTYLNFRAVGVHKIDSMERVFDKKNLKKLSFDKDTEFYAEILEYARAHSVKDKVLLWLEKKSKRAVWKKALRKYRYKMLSKAMFGKRKKYYEEKLLKLEGKSKNINLYVFR